VQVSNQISDGLDDSQQRDQLDIAKVQADVNQKEIAKLTRKPSVVGKEAQYCNQYETPESCSSSTEDSDSRSDIYILGQDSSPSPEDIISSEEEEVSSLAAASTKTAARKDSEQNRGKPAASRIPRKRARKLSESDTSDTRELRNLPQRQLSERRPAKLRKKHDGDATTTQDAELKRVIYNENIFGLFGTG
jgi:hypothetical protein